MEDKADKRAEAAEQVERELRQGRKFSPTEALARMAGPGAMKGASPVSPVRQAETEISNWLGSNMADSDGALKIVLYRHLGGSRLLLDNLDRPLAALKEYFRALLASEPRLVEIVREADIEWGRAMDERPFFDRQGAPPDPDDPYTVQKVRQAIEAALERLPGGTG